MDPIKFYLKNVYDKTLGYRATWLPNKPIKLGMIGKLEKDVFTPYDSLQNYNFEIEEDSSVDEGSFDFSSEKGVSIKSKIKGKIEPNAPSLGEADAGLIVELTDKNSYVFTIKGVTTRVILNMAAVEKLVLKLHNEGKWKKDYVIINETQEVKSATILITGEGARKIELKAKADVGLANLDIADASLDLEWVAGKKLAGEFIAQSATPLFKCVGLKPSFWGNAELRTKGDENLDETAPHPTVDILEVVEMEEEEALE